MGILNLLKGREKNKIQLRKVAAREICALPTVQYGSIMIAGKDIHFTKFS
jgi:hypothetical protein